MLKNWKAGIHTTPKSQTPGRKGTKKYERARLIQFTSLFAAGFERSQIDELMQLWPGEYEALLASMLGAYERDIEETSPLRAYAHYVIRKNSLMRELQNVKGRLAGADGAELSNPKTAQAFIGATKAQSDIGDQIVKMGLELGVLDRKSKGVTTIGGYDPRDASDKELADLVQAKLREAQELAQKSKRTKGKTKKAKKDKGAQIFVLRPDKTGTDNGE